MGILGDNAFVALGNPGTGYQIEQSLRFDGGAQLTRTPSSASNRKTWTISCWVKYAIPSGEGVLWMAGPGAYEKAAFKPGTPHDLTWGAYTNPTYHFQLVTTQVFRDPSAWFHFVFVSDTDNGTAADRKRLYINGERVTAWATQTNPSSGYEGQWNSTQTHRIGADTNPFYFNGYVAEFHSVDGTALDPTDFGEYDNNGVWRPIAYTGSYGTNGFYLTFNPGATNGIGHDHSGNGNNFSPTGFTTSGTGTDVMSDTPTTNWCTLNAVDKHTANISLSEGNLQATNTSNVHASVRGTIAFPTSGKWYYESKITGGTPYMQIGIATNSTPLDSETSGTLVAYVENGDKNINGTRTAYGASLATNDVIGVAYNADDDEVTFYKNGTSQGAISTTTNVVYFPFHLTYNNTNICNFGQRAFEQTPPTGFSALNTSNLPAPDIADGSQYFDTVLWTGNQTARTISMNSTFTPDFIWIKNRTSGYNHSLQDVVRGFGPSTKLNSNTTAAENSANTEPQAGYVDSAAAGSFDIDASATATWYHNNLNSNAYVGWCWDAGGSGSSNTDGSITSTVSANPTAGFSIVTYTGQSSNFTWGHGLGVAPSMVIIKRRNTAAGWSVYHKSLGATKRLQLDQDGGEETMSYFQNTEPTSTVFSVTTNGGVGADGDTYVAYCFAEVEGYSKFGSYTGNGNLDGVFNYCGFKPAWLLVKRTNTTANWHLVDSVRSPYNLVNTIILPDLADQESTYSNGGVDFTSNGFKIRSTGQAFNNSGDSYIFIAFAENPFGGFRTTPATAR